ncbi:MAG: immunity protein Tsi6 family protein [Permianibacter sp.]
MSERLKLFEHALSECQKLLAQYPGNGTLQSIEKQLEYLIGLESGAHTDRSRLREIIIGVQTAREIEPLDEDIAEVFYKAASEAGRM